MSQNKPKNSLALFADKELRFSDQQLPRLKAAVIEELKLIGSLERETGARAIMVGLQLKRVKNSSAHGTFMPWIKANVKGRGYQTCNFYMRLATVFVEQSGITKPDILALPGDQTSLALDDGAENGKHLLSKLSKFVGDKSLAELYDLYEIRETKKIGGARDTKNKAEPAALDTEQLYERSRDELGGVIEHAETLFLKENRLQFLAGHPEEVRGIVKSLRDLADKVDAAAKPLLK